MANYPVKRLIKVTLADPCVTEPTVADYLVIANGTFMWRTMPSFDHNITKRIVKMPRGHIRDTGLLHHLLHIGSLEQLQSSIVAGFSFEAFVIEEISKRPARFAHSSTCLLLSHLWRCGIDLILKEFWYFTY